MAQDIATVKNEKRMKKKELKGKVKKKKLEYITLGILHISHILNSILCILYINIYS